jgi:hypothetical protein
MIDKQQYPGFTFPRLCCAAAMVAGDTRSEGVKLAAGERAAHAFQLSNQKRGMENDATA